MALPNVAYEKLRHKEEKVEEILLLPERLDELPEEEIEELEEADIIPPFVPTSRIETDGMSLKQYTELIENLIQKFGRDYENNLEFLRLYGQKGAYEERLMRDSMDLSKSYGYSSRQGLTGMTLQGGRGKRHKGIWKRKYRT